MGFIYFIIITPIGLFMRLIGKDILSLKFNKNQSYWIKRSKKIEYNEETILDVKFF